MSKVRLLIAEMKPKRIGPWQAAKDMKPTSSTTDKGGFMKIVGSSFTGA